MIDPLRVRAFKPDCAALCRMVLVAALFWAHGAIAQTQAQALADINTMLAGFTAAINAHAAAGDLDYTHLLPYYDANYRHDGDSSDATAAEYADGLRGGSISVLTASSIISLATDAAGNSLASTTGTFAASTRDGLINQPWNQFSTEFTELAWYYKPAGGSWRIYGNQQPARLRVQTFTENRQSGQSCPSGCDGSYYFTWFDARAPQGRFKSVTVSGPGYSAIPLVPYGMQPEQVQASPPPAAPLTFASDRYVLNGPAVAAFPPVGSAYTFTLTPTSGATQQVVSKVLQWTTETIRITNPTGHALASANLGGPLTINWTLPATFTVSSVNVYMTTNSSAGMCNALNSEGLPANATTYTFSAVPTLCLGQPIADGVAQGYPVQVVVEVTGTNGENTRVWHSFGTTSCGGVNTPPGSLTATAATANQVQLQWNRACMPSTIANYGVYRGNAPGGPFNLVGTTDQNTRFFNDTTVSGGATYYYYVVATDTMANVSSHSNQVATTPGSTAAPSFTLPQGIIPAASVVVEPTGPLTRTTLIVRLRIEDIFVQAFAGAFAASSYNVYVAALVPPIPGLGLPAATWFVKARTAPGIGWELLSSPIKAFIEGVASSGQVVQVDILSNLDLSGLVGTEIYVGYGTSDDEMIQNRRYRGVFSVQP